MLTIAGFKLEMEKLKMLTLTVLLHVLANKLQKSHYMRSFSKMPVYELYLPYI